MGSEKTIRFDPAERLDAQERVARMRRLDPEMVDAMLGGDTTLRALSRATGRSKSAVHDAMCRLRREARK